MRIRRRHAMPLALALIGVLAFGSPARPAERTVAGVVLQQDQFFRTIQLGMQAGAKAAGVKLIEANSDSKAEKEASLIDTFVARGVNAIVISPLSATASVPALKRAADAGIPVVTFNAPVNAGFPVAYLNSSQRAIGESTGQAAAAFIKARLGGKAKIATLGFKALLPEISRDRVDGFIATAQAGGAVEVVAQQDAWLAEKAVAVATDLLTANPGINVLFGANEGGTVGAVQAVRNAGLSGKVFVFGTDGSKQIAQFLLANDDVLQAVTAQQPFEMGRRAVQAAVDHLDGKPVEKTTIIPVAGLNRSDRPGVEAFLTQLNTLK
ncbi:MULTISPECIES: substrate-binding domain-containing protein [unclassified Methylobacterium]|jgi:ABC-type sugar transport system substrate-binding protein|uniref:substrate-binding domain-containing protein n=1 Tax=unclassified Methylobacterium TaxID=2615210 RepID=UPI001354F804|nr:substrate-binding domain-containing protein [Methylobacterium sp. 2A]MWV22382.1 sugar ABC transporter substrate-binding protein [Methylobacterium sp. 2A]